jgi:predicted RNA-binding protein Jag
MSGSVKMKGKTVDEAVSMALQVLGKTIEEVEVKVLAGFWGFLAAKRPKSKFR